MEGFHWNLALTMPLVGATSLEIMVEKPSGSVSMIETDFIDFFLAVVASRCTEHCSELPTDVLKEIGRMNLRMKDKSIVGLARALRLKYPEGIPGFAASRELVQRFVVTLLRCQHPVSCASSPN
eukprot:GHVU01146470.1.p3 GENE.GHVU01146470.1~~GHVU01146470.1.p3  ORF type:complete len:124 (-),score=8.56 GHVU01146470.1:622-993(-)